MSPSVPSDAVVFFGTEEPVAPPVLLQAGALAVEFEAGNLRHIRLGPVEAIRAISFLVRDERWGTYDPLITDLAVDRGPDRFRVTYTAEVREGEERLSWRAEIQGSPGGLSFRAQGTSTTGFRTARTGFVVLHPVEGVVGGPVEIEHVDGRIEQGRFPDLIDPLQPLFDLRALTHSVGGLRIACRMEGDAFEMEDQRNWCDASYKTYVRPLSRPWPYRIEPGETVGQAVTLRIEGAGAAAPAAEEPIQVTLGAAIGPVPAIGLGLEPEQAAASRSVIDRLREIRPQEIVCLHDPRLGHDRATIEAGIALVRDLGARPRLEAIVADVRGYEQEIEDLGALVRDLGSPFATVLLSPAPDLKSTAPGQPWPEAPDPAHFFKVARRAFPGVRLAGGMISTFTEFNRKRPPLEHLDLVSFTTTAMIHAADDVSMLEGLEAVPSIARSVQAIAGDRPVAVGPSAIGLRMNPYGETPLANPQNIRRPMTRNDPRQRGLLAASWAVGYVAHLARAGVESVAIGGTTGPLGLVHTPQDWPTPGFSAAGELYPAFHALRGLAGCAGQTMRASSVSAPGQVQVLAVAGTKGTTLWLANLTGRSQAVDLPGALLGARVLDRQAWAEAKDDPATMDRDDGAPSGPFVLPPYAVARVLLQA